MATTSELKTIEHHIGGRATAGEDHGAARSGIPRPAELQAEVLLASPGDVDGAVGAAKTAFETWGDASLAQRARVMFAFRELVHSTSTSWRGSSPPSTARSSTTPRAR